MKDTLALATGNSYQLVMDNSVTAFPCCAPYPIKINPMYICPIKKGGQLEYIYEIDAIVDAYPGEFEVFKDELSKKSFEKLQKYYKERLDNYSYSHKNTKYRFFIMTKVGYLDNYYIKNIQIGKCLESNELPINKISPVDTKR